MINARNPLPAVGSRPHWTPHDCAGGLLATKTARGAPSTSSRRHLLKSAAAGTASLVAGALQSAMPGSGPTLAHSPTSTIPAPVSSMTTGDSAGATPSPGGLVGYVFNAKTQDVTIFDPATREVLATKPLGAVVRWLSNEQRFWDGRHIWTYDFPDDKVQAIAVDPRTIAVARALPIGGTGPAHSLMLTPERKTAWVNIAGSDSLAVIDLESGEVAAEVKTGKFPWDLHFTPDGRFGFVPERDQDTVSKVDLATRRIVKTVAFPEGSKPYMLRVSPDGEVVWVQTTGASTNVVLDVATMETLHTESTGHGPVQSAFGPPGSRYGLVTHLEETFVLALERETGREAARIEVGAPQANPSIAPDGATAYVTVPSRAEVVAIDMQELAIIDRIQSGAEPMGIVVFDPMGA